MLRNATETTETKMAKILRTLGNRDAIKILQFAKSGFGGSTDAHKKVGLSVKRYYYRLQKLMDVGLVVKTNNRYELTPLGVIVCDAMERGLLWGIENRDQLEIMKTLEGSKTIDGKTLERVVTSILGIEPQNTPKGAEVIKTYENLVNATYELIEGSTEKIYLVSRYTDARCVEAGWRAIGRGVDLWIIDGDVGLLSGRMKMLRMVLSDPTSIRAFYELWHSDNSHIQHRKVPFSFMVVDDRVACFEILNPTINEFFAALQVNSKRICERLMKTFHILWEGTGEDPLKGLSEDLMKGIEG